MQVDEPQNERRECIQVSKQERMPEHLSHVHTGTVHVVNNCESVHVSVVQSFTGGRYLCEVIESSSDGCFSVIWGNMGFF